MKNLKLGTFIMTIIITMLLSMAGGLVFAANGTHTKPDNDSHIRPDLAAKREMVRKQQEQRITNDKRKKAAEALKAERLRIYNAKQAVKQSSPASIDNK